jgi:hypothetical protein
MHFKQLLEQLSSLSQQERGRLRLFIASPYFSKRDKTEHLEALLAIGMTALETPVERRPDKQAVYAALFPDAPFVRGKLEQRVRHLQELIKQFLVIEQTLKPENEPDRQLLLAKEFQNRGLLTHSGQALKAMQHALDGCDQPDANYYLRKLRLTLQEHNQVILKPAKNIQFDLEQGSRALYLLFHTFKLELDIVTHSVNYRIAAPPAGMQRQILDDIPLRPDIAQDDPLLYLSSTYIALLSRTDPDEQLLHQFIQALRQREHRLSPIEIKRTWTMARNIAIHWQNLGKEKVYGQIFLELALDNLSRGLLYHHDSILHYTLESVCKVALEMGLPELSYRVLSEHRGRITGEPADEPFYRYNLARYQLYAGNLEEALDLLPHNMPDESYHLLLKVLEIQILYELNSDLLPYRMDALRLFIRRKGSTFFPAQRLLEARRFLNTLARICRCPDGNIQRAQDIMAQIRDTPRTMEYYWLMKKAAAKEYR